MNVSTYAGCFKKSSPPKNFSKCFKSFWVKLCWQFISTYICQFLSMVTCGKINTICWNIKINLPKLEHICGYDLPTNLQNFVQKDLTEVKIFQKVLGRGLLFWNTLYGVCVVNLRKFQLLFITVVGRLVSQVLCEAVFIRCLSPLCRSVGFPSPMWSCIHPLFITVV